MRVDFVGLAARLLEQAETLVPAWLPGGKRRGHEWVCGNLRGEPGASCSTNLLTGEGADFATGERWGDLIALYAAIHGIGQAEAARDLSPEGPSAKPNGAHAEPPRAADPAPGPAPMEYPPPSPISSWGGAPTGVWAYYGPTPDTGPLFLVARYDPPDGRKQFTPLTWRADADGAYAWRRKAYPAPRPLYRLRELLSHPTDPVLVVEGEKSADAAQSYLPGYAVTTWAGGANAAKTADWSPLAGRDVTIWPDADEASTKAAAWIAGALLKIGDRPTVLRITDKPEGWDVADAIAEDWSSEQILDFIREMGRAVEPPPLDIPRGTSSANVARETRARPHRAPGAVVDNETGTIEPRSYAYLWWERLNLDRVGNGAPFPNAANVETILLNHPEKAGRLYWDTFRLRKMYRDGNTEREWTDADSTHLLIWIQRALMIPKIRLSEVHHGIDAAANHSQRNSLVEWLLSLNWDGIERLPSLMHDVFGTEDDDYSRDVGRCWLISMAARALSPGCKVDTMVVLEGGQGVYKSSALELLGGAYYASLKEAFGGRDFLQSLDGVWLAEIPDMSGFKGRDIDHVKATITDRSDRYCRRYAHDAQTYPRQCVFVATANRDDWNEDETGARRFLPIRVGNIDKELIISLREQYFAEAVHRFKAGEPWWNIDKELAVKEQSERKPEDSWEPSVMAAVGAIVRDLPLNESRSVSIPEIFSKLLIALPQQGKAEQMRIAKILTAKGWNRKLIRDGDRIERRWFKTTKTSKD